MLKNFLRNEKIRYKIITTYIANYKNEPTYAFNQIELVALAILTYIACLHFLQKFEKFD